MHRWAESADGSLLTGRRILARMYTANAVQRVNLFTSWGHGSQSRWGHASQSRCGVTRTISISCGIHFSLKTHDTRKQIIINYHVNLYFWEKTCCQTPEFLPLSCNTLKFCEKHVSFIARFLITSCETKYYSQKHDKIASNTSLPSCELLKFTKTHVTWGFFFRY